jgi:hypothetical protein
MDIFMGNFNGNITLKLIKADGSQYGPDIYMGALASGGIYRYYNNKFFVDNGVTILRLSSDAVVKTLLSTSYDVNTNLHTHAFDTFTTDFDFIYYPDLRRTWLINDEYFTGTSDWNQTNGTYLTHDNQ